MRLVLLALLLLAAPALGQPTAPRTLPPVVNEAPAVNGLLLIKFDPEQLTIKRSDNRCQLWSGSQLLKDFGPLETEAREAARLIRSLHFNQYGTIAGATPAFEYWLSNDEANKGSLAIKNVIPFNAKTLKVENIANAWVIRDDKILLYNFGTQQEAAEQAYAIMRRFGFNQLGVIGIPNPVMTYLTVDAYARAPEAPAPLGTKEIINKIAEQGLMLPTLGYVGSKAPIEQRRLEVVRQPDGFALLHGKDVLARFGPDFNQAREALRVMQDARINEICLIGKTGFPLYLSHGLPPRHAGLGFNNQPIKPARMKVQVVNNVVCVVEESRIVFEFGSNRADAELVLKVMQHYQFDQICPIGPMRVLLKSR